jgi:hypothetical protein
MPREAIRTFDSWEERSQFIRSGADRELALRMLDF